ncbi:hypothetical protein [Pseudomonas synxantha]|nr:hypothetical protein [Pseudomonas synxantha]
MGSHTCFKHSGHSACHSPLSPQSNPGSRHKRACSRRRPGSRHSYTEYISIAAVTATYGSALTAGHFRKAGMPAQNPCRIPASVV